MATDLYGLSVTRRLRILIEAEQAAGGTFVTITPDKGVRIIGVEEFNPQRQVWENSTRERPTNA